jgi:hypothetical protein
MQLTTRKRLATTALMSAALVFGTVTTPPQADTAPTTTADTGTLVYLPDDVDGTEKLAPVLLANGVAYRIDPSLVPQDAPAGSIVEFMPANDTMSRTAAAPRALKLLSAPRRVEGDRTALVVLVSTPSVANTVSSEQVGSVMGDVIHTLHGISRGAMRLTYTTTTATVDSIGCEFITNQNTVRAALAGNTADHLIVVIPTSCEWAGSGYVGIGELEVTMNQFNVYTVLHELGHNFGLYHSGTATCASAGRPVEFSLDPAECIVSEYGDQDSYMGSGERVLSVPQLFALGWITAAQIYQDPSGEVQLSDSSATTGPVGVRVSAPQGGSYWFEFRAAGGNGREVQVRYSPDKEVRTSADRVDTVLLKPSGAGWSYGLTAAGSTWSDPSGTITARVAALDRYGARLVFQHPAAGTTPLPKISLLADSKALTYSLECVPSVAQGVRLVISNKGETLLDTMLYECQGRLPFVRKGTFRYDLTAAGEEQSGKAHSGTFVAATRTVRVRPSASGLTLKVANTTPGESFVALLHASDGSTTTASLQRTTLRISLDPDLSYVIEVRGRDRRGRPLPVAVAAGVSYTPLR